MRCMLNSALQGPVSAEAGISALRASSLSGAVGILVTVTESGFFCGGPASATENAGVKAIAASRHPV